MIFITGKLRIVIGGKSEFELGTGREKLLAFRLVYLGQPFTEAVSINEKNLFFSVKKLK